MDQQRQSRFGRIADAKRQSGLSRGKLYHLAAENQGLFRKAGAATIVDLEKLDRVLAALPPAEIAARRSSVGAA
jgi:hypothetical protein